MMFISIQRDDLLKGLQQVQNIVESKQALPILSNILIETMDNNIRISATDLEIGARSFVSATVKSPGGVALYAKKIFEIVKELPSTLLDLSVEENSWVLINCGSINFKMVGLPKDEFPSILEVKTEKELILDTTIIKDMINKTIFAISHEETRYILNGVLFYFLNNQVNMVATDGHRLALIRKEIFQDVEIPKVIIPKKAIYEINKVVGGELRQVSVGVKENQFILRMPQFSFTSRLLEGQYPDFDQVIPKNNDKNIIIKKDVFLGAIKRISLISEEKTKPIKLEIKNNTMRITSYNPELGEGLEEISVEYSGEDLSIGFNARYIIDALSPAEKRDIVLQVKDGNSPVILKDKEDKDYFCVIMPMRL